MSKLIEVELLEAAAIQSILKNGPQSRTDLARELQYSRASLTSIVGQLLQSGILVEVGEGKSGGGRRPRMLDINADYGYIAGIDIGATSIDIAVADFRGRLIDRYHEEASVLIHPKTFIENLSTLLLKLFDKHNIKADQLIAIGMGVPGPVEFSTGRLISPPLMPLWNSFPIKTAFQPWFPVAQVFVDNDVNIMAKGEQTAGAGQGLTDFLFIKIGTGIGCGIISDGRIYRGSNGCAGDVGHICVDYNGPICHCGNPGCVEIMAAGPAIADMGREKARSGESQFLARRLKENEGVLSAIDVGDAAAAGDRIANEIIRRSGYLIGGVLASLVNFYNPQAIFIGGGVSKIGLSHLSTIRQATLRRATALSTQQLRIEHSQLGDDGGILGAIALTLENLFVVKD